MNHFGCFIWDVNPKKTVKLVALTKSLTSNFLNFHTDIAIVIMAPLLVYSIDETQSSKENKLCKS